MNHGVLLSWYLLLSAVLFALGVAGFLFRRNIITVLMSIELNGQISACPTVLARKELE